ncbi:MAG TPA: hypothetical protein VGJ09_17390 [Bryobacteraceae bacterium]
MSNNFRFEVSRNRLVPAFLVLLGASAAGYGLYAAPDRTWPNLLLNGFYMISVAVAAIFFIASQRLTGARWSASLRRVPEALMSALPVAAVLLLAVFLGRHWIYPWSHPGAFAHAPSIAGKAQYLQAPWVFARMGLVLLLWIVFAWLFRRTSLAQDRTPGMSLAYHYQLNRYAAAFVVVFAFSFTIGTYDWIVSLDPSWFSTMFAIYVFAGTFVQGIAAVTLAVVLLKERSLLRIAVSTQQLHDLGKMLFAFSTFWAYIWTCQYLLIWYGNIPEEVTHYVKRTNGPWLPVFALNFVLNWAVPFIVLLSARAKSRQGVLKVISIVLLCGHWLDLYLLIMPSMWRAPKLGILEIATAAGYVGLLYLLFTRGLSRAPLVPLNDPVLAADAPDMHKVHILHWVPGAEG